MYYSLLTEQISDVDSVRTIFNIDLQKLDVIGKLQDIYSNPLLDTPDVSERVFENLPFENQLRFMCANRIADLYSLLKDFNKTIEYTLIVLVNY